MQPAFCNLLFWIFFSKFQTLKSYQVDLIHILEWWVQIDWATETWPERIYKPIMAMGLSKCLPFSWTTLRGKHYLHPIAIMGVVYTFGQRVAKDYTANVLSAEIADECLQTKSTDNLQ